MKHLYTLIIAITVSLLCSAQSKELHLEFMGLPISGSAELFIPRLQEKGFIKTDSFGIATNFTGKYANEIVNLILVASPRTNTVCKVIVYFPEKESWTELKTDYFQKKKNYIQQYILTDEFEFFSSPFENGDGYEMRAVVNDKCNYHSFFKDTGGQIAVEICSLKRVKVTYEDTINFQIAKQEVEQSAFDDI